MENLNSLELSEIKSLCKKYGISIVGEKKDLIKKLKYFLIIFYHFIFKHAMKIVKSFLI